MANSELLARLKKASKLENVDVLSHSKVLSEKDVVPLPIPALNIAMSGSLHGGLSAGLTVFAGESRTFKCFQADQRLSLYTF